MTRAARLDGETHSAAKPSLCNPSGRYPYDCDIARFTIGGERDTQKLGTNVMTRSSMDEEQTGPVRSDRIFKGVG